MIETEGLTKRFASKTGPVEAVRGLDLRIEPGELVAFLGPPVGLTLGIQAMRRSGGCGPVATTLVEGAP